MLKHRVVPIILTDGGFFAVQTTKFKRPVRQIGTTLQFIENMEQRNIDELILLDIDGKIVRNKQYFKVKNLTKNLFCPLTFGGGINTLDDIKYLIQDCGVDKITLRTKFSLIYSAARQFGSQAIVYSADIDSTKRKYKVYGLPKRLNKKLNLNIWMKIVQEEGAGEILLTDTELNGTEKGYNYELIKKVSSVLKIPIIANGGCGSIHDMVLAIQSGASAVASSTMFALRGITPQDCARGLSEAGLPARVEGSSHARLAAPALA